MLKNVTATLIAVTFSSVFIISPAYSTNETPGPIAKKSQRTISQVLGQESNQEENNQKSPQVKQSLRGSAILRSDTEGMGAVISPEASIVKSATKPVREVPPSAPAPEVTPEPMPEQVIETAQDRRDKVIEEAKKYVGVRYRWGGTTPAGFDCSGYVQYVYRSLGYNLPRTSKQQRYAGRVIPASEAMPGDLVWKPGHIGIYAGGNQFYDAPRSGKTIQKHKLWFKPVYIRVVD